MSIFASRTKVPWIGSVDRINCWLAHWPYSAMSKIKHSSFQAACSGFGPVSRHTGRRRWHGGVIRPKHVGCWRQKYIHLRPHWHGHCSASSKGCVEKITKAEKLLQSTEDFPLEIEIFMFVNGFFPNSNFPNTQESGYWPETLTWGIFLRNVLLRICFRLNFLQINFLIIATRQNKDWKQSQTNTLHLIK